MKKKVIWDEKGQSHLIWEQDEGESALSDVAATVISIIAIVAAIVILL